VVIDVYIQTCSMLTQFAQSNMLYLMYIYKHVLCWHSLHNPTCNTFRSRPLLWVCFIL